MNSQPKLPFDNLEVPHDEPNTRRDIVAGADSEERRSPNIEIDEPMAVRIVRSKRRKKTVGAHVVDGVVEVVVPTWMSKVEAERFADQMRARFEKKRATSDADLMLRSRSISRTYGLPNAASVRWVSNQNGRWGSCTPLDGSVRLSDRLKKAPMWVIDYVLMHEIAHLKHPDHSSAFWSEVNRYPKTERARGFLDGLGFAENEPLKDELS